MIHVHVHANVVKPKLTKCDLLAAFQPVTLHSHIPGSNSLVQLCHKRVHREHKFGQGYAKVYIYQGRLRLVGVDT